MTKPEAIAAILLAIQAIPVLAVLYALFIWKEKKQDDEPKLK